ncbi:DUF4345 domain-containing protein [Pseudomonas stutzeri]|uniref:DUF4345 domain-containing protein n=1 Tax=Stutzerimonas stutzeri TaxID=316 RepID=UPI0016BA472F|nr:DUF4345 domain-containing protein [Stutzerimonas stutzeri]MCC8344208.1 DUF4345 domain-containing protein [Stutzerimonas stutzeri]NIM33516.1 DUF4345 domain-containing protein [Stutzerimonas stutzeri]NIM56020.1 DUF4345 domain-containing protein [Stutzerimonas stutzeri]NIM88950.1 DUF4345 domain-containing protein [Stutzerimonas stutzeri]NIN82736.1 DUF4345 domain-containing protein [Stutzerimonas stutzeri]
MRFARFVLLAQALVMASLSLAYWFRPYEMANLNGMLLMEGASVSHMRVYYGGLQLGLALFLIWAARAPERARPALMMLMITMTALVLGRLVSLWLDGGELVGFDLASLVYRIFAAALAAVAWYVIRERPEPERIEPAARRRVSEPPKPFQLGEVPPTLEPAPAEPAAQPFRRGDPSE